MHILNMLTGWWGVSETSEVAFAPLMEAADMAWNIFVGWMVIPFGTFHALKVSEYLFP